jgi:hypothetical protein
MKRWSVVLVMTAVLACSKAEKREQNPGMSNPPPAMSADTSQAKPDTTMMRDTARTPARN